MAKRSNDTSGGNRGARRSAGTALFSDVTARIADFGKWISSFEVSHLSGPDLHKLVAVLGGLESQIAVCRSNVLAQITLQGGDPIDSQKRNAKSSHSSSKKNADTATALNNLPNVKEKMAQGAGMSPNKASLLAGAAKKTTPGDVNDDQTLLDKVANQDEDKAKSTIDKWVRDRQSGSQRKSQRQKNIDERQFLMFVKDGMVHSHGKTPANVRAMRLFRRWEAEKSRLWRLDGGRTSAHQSIRSDEQRGADAYANVLDGIDGQRGGLRDRADWCADVENSPPDDPVRASSPPTPAPPPAPPAPPPPRPMPQAPSAPGPAPSQPPAVPQRSQVVIVARAEGLDVSDPDVMADIIGGGPLLRNELERHMCNAQIHGMLFDASGTMPLWVGRALRHCTDAQWLALVVRDGGCVLTGADATHCEAHHIIPYQAPAKGRTNIDNLVMVSVAIHHWLHDNKLTIYQEPDGSWNTRPATAAELAPRGRRPRPDPPPNVQTPTGSDRKACAG